jgi:hypothetical protein
MDPLLVALFFTLQILQSLPSSSIHGRVTFGDADTPAANITTASPSFRNFSRCALLKALTSASSI